MNYFIPQWEERTSYGMRRIDPYTKLFEDRIIFLGTPISDEIANAVMAQLLCLQSMDPDRDISIYINSPGGSFTALTAIYDTMRYIKPDIEIQANEILRMRALLEKMISDASGKDLETVSHDIERDKYLTAAQAVEYGLIDSILDSLKAPVPAGV